MAGRRIKREPPPIKDLDIEPPVGEVRTALALFMIQALRLGYIHGSGLGYCGNRRLDVSVDTLDAALRWVTSRGWLTDRGYQESFYERAMGIAGEKDRTRPVTHGFGVLRSREMEIREWCKALGVTK